VRRIAEGGILLIVRRIAEGGILFFMNKLKTFNINTISFAKKHVSDFTIKEGYYTTTSDRGSVESSYTMDKRP